MVLADGALASILASILASRYPGRVRESVGRMDGWVSWNPGTHAWAPVPNWNLLVLLQPEPGSQVPCQDE